MIETISNYNFGNTFQHQNGPNQHQHIHKNTIQQYQQRNTSQQYQPRYYQIHRTESILYLKEDCIGCGINKKGVRELITQHDGKIENYTFIGQLSIKKKSVIEQLLQNNYKNG